MKKVTSRGRLIPRGGDDAPPLADNIMTDTPTGPMTRSRAKDIQHKVNSLLSHYQFDLSMDGLLPQCRDPGLAVRSTLVPRTSAIP